MNKQPHVIKRLLTLVILSGMAACGGKDDATPTQDNIPAEADEIETRDAAAPRPAAPDRFEYLRFATNTGAATPELCLTFSEPLDPAADYSAYVAIDAQVAFRVEGSRLCLGGLTYGQTRNVTLRQGLPSADGDGLKTEETVTLTFDDRPPIVDFAGDGVILPRIDADGLAIQTVNVAEVRITVRRLTDRALAFRSITSGFRADEGQYYYTGRDDAPNELGVELWQGRMQTEGPLNANVTTVFPIIEVLGELEAGAYYVEVQDAAAIDRGEYRPSRAERWLLVTDLAFTAYRGETGLDVTVRSLQSALPANGVEVQLVAQSNEILATARTDADGRVRFDGPLMNGEGGNVPRLLLAYGRNNDFAVLDLYRAPVDLSSQPVTGRWRPDGADGFMYLDRGIYRPGETVHASLLLRDMAGRAITDRPGTLILYQPNGIEQARVRFDGLAQAGGMSHAFTLPDTAARGMWRLSAEMDGVGTVVSETFSVEDFVPQRVALELEADTETPMALGDTRMVEASARFLYGAPGKGLPLTGTARIQVDPNPYKAWTGYKFGLHGEQFTETQFTLPDVVADGAGNATLPIAVERREAGASKPLRVRAVIEVQEPGGRAVADDIRIPYRPRETYFGIKPDFDGTSERNTPAKFSVVAVNRTGEAVAAEAQWRLVRRDYDYDWYRTEGGDWRWRRSERIVPIETGVLNISAETPATISSPPLDWGDYSLFVTVDETDVASYGFWVGWRGRTEGGVEAPDQVRVSGPATAPSTGKETRVAIRAPYAGVAEVTVATDRVLTSRQIDMPEAGAEISLPVTAEWGAGAYVMVTVYTPRDAATQPKPRRAVGVTYIPVNVGTRTYDVSMEIPERVSPNETAILRLRADDGPARETVYATIAAVDEGILLLTRHQSPDPVEWFFGKARLGVNLYDDYGRLLDPNQGAAAPVRSGGDQIGGAGLSVVPTKSVVLFEGPLDLGRDGNASVPLEMPDFNGELRLMTVVWSQTGIGAASQPVTVRDDVPAELILPRFLSPGDKALATASLDNIDGPEGDYQVTIAAEGPVSISDAEVEMSLDQGEREDMNIALEAGGEGIANVSLTAKGPRRYTVASAYPIQVRSAFWPVSRLEKVVLAPGERYTPPDDALAGFTAGSGSLQVSLAATPIDTAALFKSLYRYPYACTEQLVSRVMPLLYQKRLASLDGADMPKDATVEIQEAIETLLSRQDAQGAFGLWRMGDNDARPWIGAYAADFLTRAADTGAPVPEAAVSRALDALQPIAKGEFYRGTGYDTQAPNPRWSDDTRTRLEHRSTAYALYVLARNNRADRSRLRYMHDEMLNRIESPLARAHIGAGLAALGDRGRAANAFGAALKGVGYQNNGDWYQTPRRDMAAILALASEAGFDDIVADLSEKVVEDVPEPARLTTQEKAFMILAAGAMAGDSESFAVTYGGNPSGTGAMTFTEQSLGNAAAFTNAGETPVWVSALARGTPADPPAATSEDLAVVKRITAIDGSNVDLTNLSQGDRLVVAVSLLPQREALAPYIIADLLPAGFEIEAILKPEDAGKTGPYGYLGTLSRPKIAEARDDRFIAAVDAYRSQGEQRFAYIVRAVTPGDFALPGAVAEDMYKPDVFARSAPGRVQIKP